MSIDIQTCVAYKRVKHVEIVSLALCAVKWHFSNINTLKSVSNDNRIATSITEK